MRVKNDDSLRNTWFMMLFKASTGKRIPRRAGRARIVRGYAERQLWRRFLRRLDRDD